MAAKVRIDIGGKSDEFVGAAKKADTALSNLVSGNKKGGLSFTELNSAVNVARQALETLRQIYVITVRATVDYDKSVRDLSQNLSITTEETSRLIQVADDAGVSADQLKTAMQLAVKNGFEPSVEAIAQLADQYRSIQDPNERAAVLTEKFGRNWTTLTPLLKEGGDAIRKNANELSGARVRTKEQVDASRELEIQLDNVGDSWEDLTMTVGTAAIPTVNLLTASLNANIIAWQRVLEEMDKGDITIFQLTKRWHEIFDELEKVETQAMMVRRANAMMDGSMQDVAGASESAARMISQVTDAEIAAKAAADLVSGSMRELTAEMLYQKAAAGLDAEASLHLARMMGLVDEHSYATLAALDALTKKYDKNHSGAVDANEATEEYYQSVLLLKQGIDALQDKTVTVTYNEIHGSVGNSGGTGGGAIPTASGGHRSAGDLILAGEEGPELGIVGEDTGFIPAEATREILNALQDKKDGGGNKSGGGGVVININLNGVNNPQANANAISRELGKLFDNGAAKGYLEGNQ